MLHASHLVLRRGDHAILCGVSLSLAGGELVALMGASGSGKSAVMAALSGRLVPTSGAVWLAGRPLAAWTATALAQRCASVPQGLDLALPQTAEAMVLGGRGVPSEGTIGSRDRAAAAAALAWVGLDGRGHLPLQQLAHGERRLVQLARALAQVWECGAGAGCYVLLDDPLAGLDVAQQRRVMGIVRELARNGAAVLVATHALDLATRYCQRLLYLRAGRLLADGPPSELTAPPLLRRVFGSAAEPRAAARPRMATATARPSDRGGAAAPRVAELCTELALRPPENDIRPPPPPPAAA